MATYYPLESNWSLSISCQLSSTFINIGLFSLIAPNASSTNVPITVNLTQQQLDLLQQSYDAIKSSVYDALLLQTRFKPMLDQVTLVIDANGISLDFSQVYATFETKIGQSAANDNEWRVVA